MKVLNLQCSRQHSFEGWFGSEDDFQSQLTRGMIDCPLCADTHIQKMPSAPRLNFGAQPAQAPTSSAPAVGPVQSADEPAKDGVNLPAQIAFLKALRHVVTHTEDVGKRFADEARRMHYGEAEARGIRGQASVRDAVELLEEGIEVMPLPMAPLLKETLQ